MWGSWMLAGMFAVGFPTCAQPIVNRMNREDVPTLLGVDQRRFHRCILVRLGFRGLPRCGPLIGLPSGRWRTRSSNRSWKGLLETSRGWPLQGHMKLNSCCNFFPTFPRGPLPPGIFIPLDTSVLGRAPSPRSSLLSWRGRWLCRRTRQVRISHLGRGRLCGDEGQPAVI